MTNYRRSKVAGVTYFFTVNLADRSRSFLTDHLALLRSAFEYTRKRHPFIVEAVVILPEHIHAIWTLPEGDNDFAALAVDKDGVLTCIAARRTSFR